jgi:hypothetical protein
LPNAVFPSGWNDAAILAKVYSGFRQGIHHGSNGTAVPPHHMGVETFQSDDGGDVNLGESGERGYEGQPS